MDEPKVPSRSQDSSIPLIARLDHLEFIMKYLERKQRSGSNVPADKPPLDLAKKENYLTLLDRVACLEHRLYQLFLEMDSNSSSLHLSHVSTETSGESSSSQGSKGETFYSFPTFNNLPNNRTMELQEKSETVQHQMKKSSPPKKQAVKNKPKKSNEQKHKGGKKSKPPIAWPHLKLLGC
ncbi:hypothetical protein TanjilG_16028 [Lupinus angustifolius]|uniref:Uncharacterized protein n=1 Tax=Lupinus angustifolius TaxID=3871 RepID=A0A4P1RH89_LUPAN|nr:PREDICTED: uncharacterized protein LOC109350881 [Lupinus angustifolius]OIW10656.1 hypothetical protein TanjilG_16028 [Lupinus angustifolius]